MEKVDDGEDELRPEYDLSQLLAGGVRDRHAERYRAGANLVLLDPDVARAFPDDRAVNEALRLVIQIARLRIPGDTPRRIRDGAADDADRQDRSPNTG